MSRPNIHIIGGAGGIGKWMLKNVFLLYADAAVIHCYDTNKSALSSLTDERIRCHLITVTVNDTATTYDHLHDNFKVDDWVVFAIPIQYLQGCVSAISRVAKQGTLFIAFTSTQKDAIHIFQTTIKKNCSYLGCHPLFGPSLSSPVAQLVALVEYRDDIPTHRTFKQCLHAANLLSNEVTASMHDKNMAIIQALTHFTYLSFAATINKPEHVPESLSCMATPNFQFLYAFMSRILKIAPTTIGSIQKTAEAANMRSQFLQAAQALDNALTDCATIDDAARVIDVIRSPFLGKDIAEGAEIAAVAVDSVRRSEEIFYKYKKTGEPCIFTHKTTGVLHIVKIVEIYRDSIKYIESTKKVYLNRKTLYAIGLSDQARSNYEKQGYTLPNTREITTKKRNIELLQVNQKHQFYKNTILPIELECSLSNPHGYDERHFEQSLPLLMKDLWSVEFKESYRKKGQVERVSLRITFNPDLTKTKIVQKIQNLLLSPKHTQ